MVDTVTAGNAAMILAAKVLGSADGITSGNALMRLAGLNPTAIPLVTDYSASRPLYIAHRGGSLVAPENTLEAYRYIYGQGARVIEPDCHLLADGSIGVMHDTTVDRTTTGTGTVATLNAVSFKALAIDAGTQIGGGWSDTISPPLLDEVLAEFRGRVIFTPDAKNVGSGAAIVTKLQSFDISTDQAIVSSAILSELAAAVTAGYPALYLASEASDKATIWNAGVRWVTLDANTTSDAGMVAWVTYGFKVVPYTVVRRWQRDKYLAMGVTGFYSDDPIYLSGTVPSYTADPWASQVWLPGMIYSNEAIFNAVARGRFIAADGWGWTDTTALTYLMQGWAGPIKGSTNPGTFSIYFKVRFDSALAGDATRWAAVFLADATMGDRGYSDTGATVGGVAETGYNILLRKNGAVQIYTRVGATATQVATTGATAIADAEEVSYKVTVTPTDVAVHRLNADGSTNYSATYASSVYRGGYFHFGRNQLACRFRDVVVV